MNRFFCYLTGKIKLIKKMYYDASITLNFLALNFYVLAQEMAPYPCAPI